LSVPLNFLTASPLTGVKRLTRFPSGSQKGFEVRTFARTEPHNLVTVAQPLEERNQTTQKAQH
jgi:hypothetical protein